jgi:hypothetical protein
LEEEQGGWSVIPKSNEANKIPCYRQSDIKSKDPSFLTDATKVITGGNINYFSYLSIGCNSPPIYCTGYARLKQNRTEISSIQSRVQLNVNQKST